MGEARITMSSPIFFIKETKDSYEIYCKGDFVGDIWKNGTIEIICREELKVLPHSKRSHVSIGVRRK